MLYRYSGSETIVGDLKLNKFGQQVEFTDELAKIVSLGGGSILPANDPAWTAFTEQELSIYADQRTHADAKPAFLSKKRAVQIASIALRARLEEGEASGAAPAAAVAIEAPETVDLPAAA